MKYELNQVNNQWAVTVDREVKEFTTLTEALAFIDASEADS